MKKIYVAGFLLLALINGIGLMAILNPASLGINVLPSYYQNPLYLVNLGTLSIAIILSLASAIAFFIQSAHAYKIGLVTGIFGLLLGIISINIIGIFFYGIMTWEMW